jgi:hypothetical protein
LHIWITDYHQFIADFLRSELNFFVSPFGASDLETIQLLSDQAKQQRLDDPNGSAGGNMLMDDPSNPNSNYVTLEMRQSRRGTLKSQGQNLRNLYTHRKP